LAPAACHSLAQLGKWNAKRESFKLSAGNYWLKLQGSLSNRQPINAGKLGFLTIHDMNG